MNIQLGHLVYGGVVGGVYGPVPERAAVAAGRRTSAVG
jgi:hypothetical protein